METVTISKHVFAKILADVQVLVDDVELAFDSNVSQRHQELQLDKVQAKSEQELDDYLRRRGVKIE